MARIKELRDTVGLMLSDDYRDRIAGEYKQLRIRYESLLAMIDNYEKDAMDFVPNCPIALLKHQAKIMSRYLHILEQRAEIESITLV